MDRLNEQILCHARNQSEGVPVTAKGLLHLGSRAAVDQTLSRLSRSGELLRLGRGLYVLPVKRRFGSRAPSVEKTVKAFAAQRGEQIANGCAMAANALRLTTQVPVKRMFLTSGRSRTLTLGRQEIELRHAPPWQLVLGNRKAGEAVRALAWVGRERAGLAVEEIRRSLTREERRELRSVCAQMPGWLVSPVSRLAYG